MKVWHRYALPHGSNSQTEWFKISFSVSSVTIVYVLHSAVSCKEYVPICSHPALGDFDEPKRSSLTMFGVLTSAVRIYQDRLGYGIYSGPIGTAVFMITVKWVSLRDIRCCSDSAFKSRAPHKLVFCSYWQHGNSRFYYLPQMLSQGFTILFLLCSSYKKWRKRKAFIQTKVFTLNKLGQGSASALSLWCFAFILR